MRGGAGEAPFSNYSDISDLEFKISDICQHLNFNYFEIIIPREQQAQLPLPDNRPNAFTRMMQASRDAPPPRSYQLEKKLSGQQTREVLCFNDCVDLINNLGENFTKSDVSPSGNVWGIAKFLSKVIWEIDN